MTVMLPLRFTVLAAAAFVAAGAAAQARPNLDTARPLAGLTVYADDSRPGLFFYAPGPLHVAQDADGRPDVHFLAVRYTGTAATGDRGRTLQRGLLTFSVTRQVPDGAALATARRTLGGGGGLAVELRPLPIRRLEATLVYAAPGRIEEAPVELSGGHFEEAEGAPATGALWTRRTYSLGLDAASAELFEKALAQGRLLLSLGYSFHAASGEAADTQDRLVSTGTVTVSVDVHRWPGLSRRMDLNERVPPDYPLLDVYCYDFRDALHPGLYEKQVEVEAEAVGGGPVSARVRFGRDQPDLYARGLRFQVAVRLDRPYRYRVTTVTDAGTSAAGPWLTRGSWSQLLDVTTPGRPAEARADATGEDR